MPRKFKTGRRKMRRTNRKRGYKTLVNNRSLAPIAQRYITKMKYAEVITSALGLGTYGFARMNLNSLFDPNQTGLGHQPYGYDQLAGLYNRYRVIGCKYHVFVSSSDNTVPLQLACISTNETVTPSSISEIRENPRAKYILQGVGAALKKVSGNVYIPSLVGRTKSQYMADDRYQAVVTASPAELALLSMYAGPATETSSSISVTFNIEMEFTVEFFDIKHQTQS